MDTRIATIGTWLGGAVEIVLVGLAIPLAIVIVGIPIALVAKGVIALFD